MVSGAASEQGESVPRAVVSFWCSNGHEVRIGFALAAVTPEEWDCLPCGLLAGTHRDNAPALISTVPLQRHLGYLRRRRTQEEGDLLPSPGDRGKDRCAPGWPTGLSPGCHVIDPSLRADRRRVAFDPRAPVAREGRSGDHESDDGWVLRLIGGSRQAAGAAPALHRRSNHGGSDDVSTIGYREGARPHCAPAT